MGCVEQHGFHLGQTAHQDFYRECFCAARWSSCLRRHSSATLNIDDRLIEDAVTPRTKALCVVHYAGIACEMDSICEIARNRRLLLIEDAAQGLPSSYRGRSLGSIGHLGALSFHETKNEISGEGGALLVNDDRLVARAEIIWEKGTNRSEFFRGQIDKYTWVDIPGEIVAAFLWAQLFEAKAITERRLALWKVYFEGFRQAEIQGLLRRPIVPVGQQHTAHMFYILVESITTRRRVLDRLRSEGYLAVFHYVPLHSSPAGRHYGRVASSMQHTDDVVQRLIRLPLWIDLLPDTALQIIDTVVDELRR